MEIENSLKTENNDFCVEVEDDESILLNSNASKVKDQNSRLLEVYKKTQSNCKVIKTDPYIIIIFF
jgi:hypothetical protein